MIRTASVDYGREKARFGDLVEAPLPTGGQVVGTVRKIRRGGDGGIYLRLDTGQEVDAWTSRLAKPLLTIQPLRSYIIRSDFRDGAVTIKAGTAVTIGWWRGDQVHILVEDKPPGWIVTKPALVSALLPGKDGRLVVWRCWP